jgi:hypothetical protein
MARRKKPDFDTHTVMLRTLCHKHASVEHIWKNSWASRSTIRKLMDGTTKRPQHSTMRTIAEAMGFEWKCIKKGRG